MTQTQSILRSFFHALGVLAYVTLVAFLLSSKFGVAMPSNILAPLTILMLLIVSVAVVGMLIFAKPVMMYLDGMKIEAIRLTIYTVVWLAIFLMIALYIAFSMGPKMG